TSYPFHFGKTSSKFFLFTSKVPQSLFPFPIPYHLNLVLAASLQRFSAPRRRSCFIFPLFAFHCRNLHCTNR
ncbi:hypothetical protein Gogos_004565, partial [Gossypium gossypioides]|nr:hypothetical protein [Gossypium gossypioides]